MKKIYLEISDVCDLKCSFCPAPKAVRGEMGLDMFQEICQQIKGSKKFSQARLCLHILGDPLRHSQIEEIFDCVQNLGLKIDLVTSGFHKLGDFLFSSALHQIAFSLSAYLDVKNPKPKNYLDRILAFCALHQKRQERFFINFRIQSVYLQGLFEGEFMEFCGELLGFFQKTIKDLKECFCRGERRFKLAEYIFLTLTDRFEWPGFEANQRADTQRFCHGVLDQIGVLSDGRVVPCCLDACGQIVLGRIAQNSLTEILESKLALEMAQGFKEGYAVHPVCQVCKFPVHKD